MKKILNLIKKTILIMEGFIISIDTKVKALSDIYMQPEYGVISPTSKVPEYLKIAKIVIIPLVFIIGIITYYKKSSNEKAKKMIKTIALGVLKFLLEILNFLGYVLTIILLPMLIFSNNFSLQKMNIIYLLILIIINFKFFRKKKYLGIRYFIITMILGILTGLT